MKSVFLLIILTALTCRFSSANLLCKDFIGSKASSKLPIKKKEESFFTDKTLTKIQTFEERGLKIQIITNSLVLNQNAIDFSYKKISDKKINALIEPVASFIKKQYPRRKKWNQDFISKVSKNLIRNFFKSNVLTVQEPGGKLLASMGVIASPYHISLPKTEVSRIHKNDKLPIEDFFKNEVSRPRLSRLPRNKNKAENYMSRHDPEITLQSTYEVTNLAIEKHDKRKEVLGLLLKYFIYMSYSPTALGNVKSEPDAPNSLFEQMRFFNGQNQFYAYGEREALLMYLPYGFKKDKTFEEKDFMEGRWTALFAGGDIWANVAHKYNLHDFGKEAADLVWSEGIHPFSGQTRSDTIKDQNYRSLESIYSLPGAYRNFGGNMELLELLGFQTVVDKIDIENSLFNVFFSNSQKNERE